MLEDINTFAIGRIEIWTKSTEHFIGVLNAGREVATVLSEGLVYVVENGLAEGPLLASGFVRESAGSMEEVTKAGTATTSVSVQRQYVQIGFDIGEVSAKNAKGVLNPQARTQSSERAREGAVSPSPETERPGAGRTTDPELSPGMVRATKLGVRYRGRT